MKFSHSFLVTLPDIDSQGHVNNVSYVRWIQDIAVAHWFSQASEELREKFAWVVIRHEIDYKKQAFENEAIVVNTWVGEPTRISWERFTEIKRGEHVLCKARSVWCLINKTNGKPARIGDDIKKLF